MKSLSLKIIFVRHLKHLIFINMFLILIFLCSCSKSIENTIENVETLDISHAETNNAVLPSIDEQLDCLVTNENLWFIEDEYIDVYYTITDLDHNGLVEIISTSCAGSGLYSTSYFFEVSKDGKTLISLKYGVEEGDSEPDLMYEGCACYSKDDNYYYLFKDILRNGSFETYTTKYTICKKEREVIINGLGTELCKYDENNNKTVEYYDDNGNSIADDKYSYLEDTIYPNFKFDYYTLFWKGLKKGEDYKKFFKEAYETFVPVSFGN